MRSAHHDEDGVLLNRFRCDVLAESFGGGGHVGAASLYMKKKEWKKLMYEWIKNLHINDILFCRNYIELLLK